MVGRRRQRKSNTPRWLGGDLRPLKKGSIARAKARDSARFLKGRGLLPDRLTYSGFATVLRGFLTTTSVFGLSPLMVP